MATDARSLLRAATSQRRAGIQDRFASYHPTTQALRCAACAYLPIKHESLWSSHASSKSHRVNVARVLSEEKEKETAAAAAAGLAKGKRKQGDEDLDGEDDAVGLGASSSSQQGSSLPTSASNSKRARIEGSNGESDSKSRASAGTGAGGAVDEDEWARFEREVLEGTTAAADATNDFDIHASATISAEPVLLINGAGGEGEMEGMEMDDEQADDGGADAGATEEEQRLEREREEREEILMRFEEEQRIQDEADERVNALKNRIQALKAARLAKQQAGTDSGASSKANTTGTSKKTKGAKKGKT
ncbi:hypothetical protein CF327_g3657 [Tilletia walkeri]|uniref:Zinc finger protein 830 n=1 Tax=Tilletia walkeri TaxID=117179 RepID=A0A8X7NCW5_9BASI|nr:hypothetical protein CF327_g3657 [Tilletia walkeri]KAE8270728.1 hypothetical protein A4X09_0g1599 [Tilletia walkeri]